VRGSDDEPPANFLHRIAQGSLTSPAATHVTIHHDARRPSHLLLPVTRGNLMGTFISGGKLS
jgi:hypothetical protein